MLSLFKKTPPIITSTVTFLPVQGYDCVLKLNDEKKPSYMDYLAHISFHFGKMMFIIPENYTFLEDFLRGLKASMRIAHDFEKLKGNTDALYTGLMKYESGFTSNESRYISALYSKRSRYKIVTRIPLRDGMTCQCLCSTMVLLSKICETIPKEDDFAVENMYRSLEYMCEKYLSNSGKSNFRLSLTLPDEAMSHVLSSNS